MSDQPSAGSKADLSFLAGLFEVFRPLRRHYTYGLNLQPLPDSALAADDLAAKGYGPSILARKFIANAADHEHAIETIVASGQIGNAGLWGLMRCLLEALAQTAYVLMPRMRDDRIAYALALSYHDYQMAKKYFETTKEDYNTTGPRAISSISRASAIFPKSLLRTGPASAPSSTSRANPSVYLRCTPAHGGRRHPRTPMVNIGTSCGSDHWIEPTACREDGTSY